MEIWILWKNRRRTKRQRSSGRKAERGRRHARYPTFEHSGWDTERRFNKGTPVAWVLRWTRRAVSNRYSKEIARKAQRWRDQTCEDDWRYVEAPEARTKPCVNIRIVYGFAHGDRANSVPHIVTAKASRWVSQNRRTSSSEIGKFIESQADIVKVNSQTPIFTQFLSQRYPESLCGGCGRGFGHQRYGGGRVDFFYKWFILLMWIGNPCREGSFFRPITLEKWVDGHKIHIPNAEGLWSQTAEPSRS